MAKRQSRKPAPKALKKEGNVYDKLFKENIEKIFRPLIEKRLGVKIIKSTPLKEKMQTTIEVEMDFFYIIETDTELILRTIVENLKQLVKHKRTFKKYLNQLMMLSRLRKIEELTIKIAEEMPVHYDITTDALYKRGTEKGREEGREEGIEAKNYISVTNLLLDTDFDDERIARLVKVPPAFVQQVKNERQNFNSVSSLLLDPDIDEGKIVRLLNVSLDFVKKVKFIESLNHSF